MKKNRRRLLRLVAAGGLLLVPLLAAAVCQAQVVVPLDSAGREGQFLRLWWFQSGLEYGNAPVNERFRVNSPEVVLHPLYYNRDEPRGSGMMQIRMEEDLTQLDGVDLYAELWGGHPGTANKRFTPNGRTTYYVPDVGAARGYCTHQYITAPMARQDMVRGYNAIQFACDQGTSFWGHFIVEEAALRAVLKKDHPDLKRFGLAGFEAAVGAEQNGESIRLELRGADLSQVAGVTYQGFYSGYDENGNTLSTDWHGFTKRREPVAFLGSSAAAPFRIQWDTSMLPEQTGMKVRALISFRDHPELLYITPALGGLEVSRTRRVAVSLHLPLEIPAPFWSRASHKKECTIDLPYEPDEIERAELHVIVWDGGRGSIEHPFTLNGHPLAVTEGGQHDVLYRVLPLDRRILKRGANRIEILSDTEHHGIEVLLPGPALAIRHRLR